MNMKATVLIDNIADGRLAAEWGLAVYVEYGDKKILLDTGSTGIFTDNADVLGIELADIDYAVLSHAHYDHADGMEAFFARNKKAKFYLRAGASENCYKNVWLFKKYIGIKRGTLARFADRIEYADGDYELAPGVTLIPHKTEGLESIGKKAGMCVRRGARFYPERFEHEQSLVFDTDKGLVIFNSCSHGGADNIITEVQRTYPGKHIYAIIGGFHLFMSSDETVRALAARIKATGIERVITGHCTGKRAYEILREELGEMVTQIHSGLVIE